MTSVPVDVRDTLMRQYGSFTQAYSATYQPGLLHFGNERGFMAYRKVGVRPLCSPIPSRPRAIAAI